MTRQPSAPVYLNLLRIRFPVGAVTSIAHRISSIENADEILVINRGILASRVTIESYLEIQKYITFCIKSRKIEHSFNVFLFEVNNLLWQMKYALSKFK